MKTYVLWTTRVSLFAFRLQRREGSLKRRSLPPLTYSSSSWSDWHCTEERQRTTESNATKNVTLIVTKSFDTPMQSP